MIIYLLVLLNETTALRTYCSYLIMPYLSTWYANT